jgi:lysophospholipase L1-like esterase
MAIGVRLRGLSRFLALAFAVGGACAANAAPPACRAAWHGVWGASPMGVAGDDPLLPAALTDTTLRQTVKLGAATGGRLRLRLSNLMGKAPLRVDHVRIALIGASGSARIDPARSVPLLFAGQSETEIPAGADYLSDPVDMPTRAGAVLSVDVHVVQAPDAITSHPGSRTTSRIAPGDQTGQADLRDDRPAEHWYLLSGVETQGCGATIVAFGDSITDGHGATTNGDDRWPDSLSARLTASGRQDLAIVNAGIGGNRLLLDGLGPNALARFDRDVLAQPGVRFVILLEGVNDLGTLTRDRPATPGEHRALVQRIIAAYAQMIAKAHARGVALFGGTILPYGGSAYYHPDALNEADRQAVNAWIRAPGHFDGVIDFDGALRDPSHPDRLLPAYDSGDHLHPGPEGYARMAGAIPLGLFKTDRSARRP